MASKAELLDEFFTRDSLKALAEKKGVDLEGATSKADIVDTLAASRKIKAAELKQLVEDHTDAGDDDLDTSSEDDVPAGHVRTLNADGSTVDIPSGPANQATSGSTQPEGDTSPGEEESGDYLPTTMDVAGAPGTSARTDEERKAILERVGGRTSDSKSKLTLFAGETPPDITDGPKQSDGGPERFPFPTSGDVDFATIEPKHYKGETMPALNGESWVVLGEHPDVPERYWGGIAAVIEAPVERVTDPSTGRVREFTHPDAEITVRERSQGGTFTLPLAAFKRISLGGRAGVNPIP